MTTKKTSSVRAQAAGNVRELMRWAAEARSLPLPEAVRRRVRLVPHVDVGPPPRDRSACVVWKFRNGEEISAVCENPRGGGDQPFDETMLLSNLADNAGAVFPSAPKLLSRIIGGEREATRIALAGCRCEPCSRKQMTLAPNLSLRSSGPRMVI